MLHRLSCYVNLLGAFSISFGPKSGRPIYERHSQLEMMINHEVVLLARAFLDMTGDFLGVHVTFSWSVRHGQGGRGKRCLLV